MADLMRSIRISRPQHVRRLLNETINEIRRDEDMDPVTKARLLTNLSSVTLSSIKDGDLERRLSALEKRLKDRL